MTVTLVMPQHIADQIFEAAAADVETAGVLLARYVKTPLGDTRLLARQVQWVPDAAYRVRDATEMKIASHGYVPALAAAEADQSVPIWIHTHPEARHRPDQSKRDEIVDEELTDLFRLRSGSPLYAAVVFSRTRGRLSFTGHIESTPGASTLIACGLLVEGSRSFQTGSMTSKHRPTIRQEHSCVRRRDPKGAWRPPRGRRRLRWHRISSYRATRAPRRTSLPPV